MGQHEIEKCLLFGVELGIDMHPRLIGPHRPRDRRQRVGHVGQHVKQIALFRINDFLHFRQLVVAKSFVGQPVQQLGTRGLGALQYSVRNSSSLWKKSGSLPVNSIFHELLRRHRRAVRMPERGGRHVLDVALLAVGQLHLRSFSFCKRN